MRRGVLLSEASEEILSRGERQCAGEEAGGRRFVCVCVWGGGGGGGVFLKK